MRGRVSPRTFYMLRTPQESLRSLHESQLSLRTYRQKFSVPSLSHNFATWNSSQCDFCHCQWFPCSQCKGLHFHLLLRHSLNVATSLQAFMSSKIVSHITFLIVFNHVPCPCQYFLLLQRKAGAASATLTGLDIMCASGGVTSIQTHLALLPRPKFSVCIQY